MDGVKKTKSGVIFITILLHFHYSVSLETVNTKKSKCFFQELLQEMWLYQLLLADILKFTISVLRKNFQKLFINVFIYDFNHKFYNTFYEEQSYQLCLLLVVSQLITHSIYTLADIDCAVLIRRIHISSSRTKLAIKSLFWCLSS